MTTLQPLPYPDHALRPTVDYLLTSQRDNGEIPWFEGGHTDPWNHTEAAMGLSIAGEFVAAERAYDWLVAEQLDDGSWWASYIKGQPSNVTRRETNYVAYIATGVWHHYLISQDRSFLTRLFPTVERAIDFVVSMQSEHGEVAWACDTAGVPMDDALVTGSSSVYKSLECALHIARTVGVLKPAWRDARSRLGAALRHRPERFDRNWESKSRYAMDWFYPVLAGVFEGAQGLERINARWDEFIEEGLGCRCENHQPWVTVAESCELTMALLSVGDVTRARTLFEGLWQWRDAEGIFWTGYQFVEEILWPLEQPTWTAGAVLLAADALSKHTAASRLFTEVDTRDHAQLERRQNQG
ncbi:prenyltransferase [Luminiphilus sp.]|nr:prenyltransferase [Luminiphilus sp.]MDB2511111.1 prenyltransferase [Luminiphilus sp.]